MQATMAPTQIISVSSLVSSFIGFLLGLSDNVGPCQELFERTTVCTQRRAPFRSHRWCCLFQP